MSVRGQQESLDFGRVHLVADAARLIYRKLNDAVDILGITVAAGTCGIDRGDLRRSLDRDGRRVAVEHAIAIATAASYDASRQIVEAFAGPTGLAVADQRPPISDRERADRLEGALRALGPLGDQALTAALGGRR